MKARKRKNAATRALKRWKRMLVNVLGRHDMWSIVRKAVWVASCTT